MNEQEKTEFGKLLSEVIEAADLKKKTVAKQAGIHEVSLPRILKGEYGVKRPTAIRLIEAINFVAGREIVNKRDALAAAGYSSNEEDIERQELETVYRKRKALTGKRKESFANLLDMVDRELDRMYAEEMAEKPNGNG